jgi:hypothetical protein
MKITGEQLYTMQAEEYDQRGVGVEFLPWDQLTPMDREVWDAMAERLGDRVFKVTGRALPEDISTLRVYGPAGRDIGSFEEVFGGFVVKEGETVLQALAGCLPQGFMLATPGAMSCT